MIISILSIFVISCKKEILLDLRTVEPILVVEAEIAEGGTATVKLTQTADFYQPNIFNPITDADVTLSNNFGETEDLTLVGDSMFVSNNIVGTINTTYYLSITYNNKTYTSSSTLYPPVPLDSVVPKQIRPDERPYFMVYWQDVKGKEIDYYRFRIVVNGSVEVKQNIVYSADIYDGEYLYMPIMIAEKDREDKQVFLPGDVLRFDMQTLDTSAGEFFSFLRKNGGTNPPTNITGGALGYFSAYSVSSQFAIAPQWDVK
ncbi:MAG: DUF4249 domain-containing protein [Paludibacter sp.]|nr:DUF4249 domain-containing protein [Paludibacter sp.]